MKVRVRNFRVFSSPFLNNVRADWKERYTLYRNPIGAAATFRRVLFSMDSNDARDLIDDLQKFIAWRESQ